MRLRALIGLVLLLVVVTPAIGLAVEQASYPPYPDVWLYRHRAKIKSESPIFLSARFTTAGDLLIRASHGVGGDAVFSPFTGPKTLRDWWALDGGSTFVDGESGIHDAPGGKGRNEWRGFEERETENRYFCNEQFMSVRSINGDGRLQYEKTLVYVRKTSMRFHQGCLGADDAEAWIAMAAQMFVPLKDGTFFLVLGNNEDEIIAARFSSDGAVRWKANDLYWVDIDVVDRAIKRSRPYDSVDDAQARIAKAVKGGKR